METSDNLFLSTDALVDAAREDLKVLTRESRNDLIETAVGKMVLSSLANSLNKVEARQAPASPGISSRANTRSPGRARG